HGRRRPAAFFNCRNSAMPVPAASAAAPTARTRAAPPNDRTIIPMAYHSHPSPPRVAHSIHTRIQRGASQRWTRCMRPWSRRVLYRSITCLKQAPRWTACTIGLVKKLDFIFFDAGGGHRAAANALREVMESQGRPVEIHMVNLQET